MQSRYQSLKGAVTATAAVPELELGSSMTTALEDLGVGFRAGVVDIC